MSFLSYNTNFPHHNNRHPLQKKENQYYFQKIYYILNIFVPNSFESHATTVDDSKSIIIINKKRFIDTTL